MDEILGTVSSGFVWLRSGLKIKIEKLQQKWYFLLILLKSSEKEVQKAKITRFYNNY